MTIKNKIICWIWSKIWSRWLYDYCNHGNLYWQCQGHKRTVIAVKGWRTALVQTWTGSRMTMTCLFKGEK